MGYSTAGAIIMDAKNILEINEVSEFRSWLVANHNQQDECWLFVKKGKSKPNDHLWYLEAVEQALCFGWIDTTHKNINGRNLQKFTPRAKRSQWSELNKARCRRLERLGQMTEAGRSVLPDLTLTNFKIDETITHHFEENPIAWQNFKNFPPLYQHVRIDSIQRDKAKDASIFSKRLTRLITQSAQNMMYGEWNDNGRLPDD